MDLNDIFRETINNNRLSISLLDSAGNSLYAMSNNELVIDRNTISTICGNERGSLKQARRDTIYYINYSTLDVNGWKLVTAVPVNDYLKSSSTIFIYNAAMLLFYILFIIVVSLRVSGAASKNLSRLNRTC